jgi:LPXTG-motif cell wall-anchored protein
VVFGKTYGFPYLATGMRFVEVTFEARVNNEILTYETDETHTVHTVGNQATVDFTNQAGQKTTYKTNKAEVHTGQIIVTKRDAKDDTLLEMVFFKIASSEENALAGNYLKKKGGNILDVNDTGYTDVDAADYVIKTDQNGTAKFEGLLDYTEDGLGTKTGKTYWIVETQAKQGYNLLNGPAAVTFDPNQGDDVVKEGYKASITVKNSKGFTLPKTGGAGTALFTAGGVALMGVAILLVVIGRKKGAKGEKAK